MAISVWYNERKDEYSRRFKMWSKKADEYRTARIEASADLTMYKALESGVIEAIKSSISTDGHEPIGTIIENTRAFWGNVLVELTRKIQDTEAYLNECAECEETAERELNDVASQLRSLMNEENESRSLLSAFGED